MEKEEVKIKCWLCEKEYLVLISIEVADERFFNPAQGICWDCFKEGNLDERLFSKSKKRIEENIEGAEKNKKFWEEKLKELLPRRGDVEAK